MTSTVVDTITRRYRFCASHRLHSRRLSAEENLNLFGKCNNANGHGHNYVVFVSISGPVNPETGMIVELGALDEVVRTTIVERFDQRDLNLHPAFADHTTSGENVARLIWELLVDRIPAGRLVKIGLIETRDNYFECTGPADRGQGESLQSLESTEARMGPPADEAAPQLPCEREQEVR